MASHSLKNYHYYEACFTSVTKHKVNLLIDGKDWSNRDEAVDIWRSVQRVEADYVFSLLFEFYLFELRYITTHRSCHKSHTRMKKISSLPLWHFHSPQKPIHTWCKRKPTCWWIIHWRGHPISSPLPLERWWCRLYHTYTERKIKKIFIFQMWILWGWAAKSHIAIMQHNWRSFVP